jgi:alkylmercury lyase
MTNTEHDNDASPADLTAGCCGIDPRDPDERVTVTCAVVGLTNFGERPVPSTRLAKVLGRPVTEAEALARQWGWPGTRVEDGFITVNPERAKSAARRQVQIGDRRFGVSGCACDIFWAAPLVRPSLQLEETCPATGTPIRIVFTPRGVEHVEPADAAVAMLRLQECRTAVETAGDVEEVDASVCVQMPLFASAEAAKGWLGTHPGSRVLPIREVWDESGLRELRDRMSALLDLTN